MGVYISLTMRRAFVNYKMIAYGNRMTIVMCIWGGNVGFKVFLGLDVPLSGHMNVIDMLPCLPVHVFI